MSKFDLTFADLFEATAPLSTEKGDPGKTTSPYTDKAHLTTDTLKDVSVADENVKKSSSPKKSPSTSEEPKAPKSSSEDTSAKAKKVAPQKQSPKTSEEPKEPKTVEESFDEFEIMEHDISSDEIAMTKDFLRQLLVDISEAGLDGDQIDYIVDACKDAIDEDRALDLDDIPTVMDVLKQAVGYTDDVEIDVDGDGDVEIEDDIYTDEDDTLDIEDDGKVELYGELDECDDKDDLKEAFIASIPRTGLKAKKTGNKLADELAAMKRLAGI